MAVGLCLGAFGCISLMPAVLGCFAGNGRGSKGNSDIVNCLVHNTLTVSIPVDYTPPCDGTVAVIVLPCDATGQTNHQISIANMPLPDYCECKVSTQCAVTAYLLSLLLKHLPLPWCI
jgi:hypothetical protein